MHVLVKSRDRQDAPSREEVDRRVRFVLRRFSGKVSRAEVTFTDINGPRGGVDKHCRVELHTGEAGPVIVSAVAPQWKSALDVALSRLGRFVRRLWQRLVARTRVPARRLKAIAAS